MSAGKVDSGQFSCSAVSNILENIFSQDLIFKWCCNLTAFSVYLLQL